MPRYKLRQAAIDRILKRVVQPDQCVLEIGYGGGEMLMHLARRGLRVFGYDTSPDACTLARQRIAQAPPQVRERIRLFDTMEEVQTQHYQVVCAFEVLEHARDDRAALHAYRSLLKENGILLISVPARMALWGRNDDASGHCRRYERAELTELLQQVGFTVRYFWTYGFPLTLLLDPLLHRGASAEGASDTEHQRIERTQQSGIVRTPSLLLRIVSSDSALFPFYLLQLLFLHTSKGSAYLVCAERAEGIAVSVAIKGSDAAGCA